MLTNHSAYIKHQRDIYALSALYHIYSTAKAFEVWLHHDIYNYMCNASIHYVCNNTVTCTFSTYEHSDYTHTITNNNDEICHVILLKYFYNHVRTTDGCGSLFLLTALYLKMLVRPLELLISRIQSVFLIHFKAWAILAQQCAALRIHLEPINKELMLLVTM